MGKSKAEKKGDGVQQRHVHSRLSYLHQAATYLSTNPHEAQVKTATGEHKADVVHDLNATQLQGEQRAAESRQLLTQIREISQKTQIRVTPDMKRSLCKRCQSLLIAGSTSRESVVNPSRDEAKPWADVFEIYCNTCGTVKRFPIGQQRVEKRKKQKKDRGQAAGPDPQQTGVEKGASELK